MPEPMAGQFLGDGELGAQVTAGKADLSGRIDIVANEWKGEVNVTAAGLTLEPQLGLKGTMSQYAGAAFKEIRRFNAKIRISGRESDLHFKVESDLGRTLAEGMKRGVTTAFAAQRKAAEDKINALYSEKAGAIAKQSDALKASLAAPLQRQEASIQNALKEAAAKSFGGSPFKFKNPFR